MITANRFLGDASVFLSSSPPVNPTISIIMPVCNRATGGKLHRAIQSVLGQSFTDFELICIDDGSQDETMMTVLYFQSLDTRITYVRHEVRCGIPALRLNEGIRLAKGDFIAYQYDDDWWLPHALLVLYQHASAQAKPSLVYGTCILHIGSQLIPFGQTFDTYALPNQNLIGKNAVLHPKSFLLECGGYDCHIILSRLSDWALWQRWAERYPFIHVNVVVSHIETGQSDAISTNTPLDLDIFRAYSSFDKGSSLLLDQLPLYEVDRLDFLTESLSSDFIAYVKQLFLQPWYAKYISDEVVLTPERRKINTTLLVSKSIDPCIDITLNNFRDVSRNLYHPVFVPESQIAESTVRMADIVVLHRTFRDVSLEIQKHALSLNRPVLYMLDDDMLAVHELGREYDFLAPGQPNYETMIRQMENADLVVTYSPLVMERIRSLNPRVIQLSTNIQMRYVSSDFAEPPTVDTPLRIGLLSGYSRQTEIEFIWPALQQLSYEMGDRIQFLFWGGFWIEHLPKLSSPVIYRHFQAHYYEYLQALRSTPLDIVLVPLFDNNRLKRAKCPIKYLETTAAGSIGIYSNTVVYEDVEHGVTGLKTANTVSDWLSTIRQACALTYNDRREMWTNARRHLLSKYTTESQLDSFGAMIEAVNLHAKLRQFRDEEGMPRIAYFCEPDGCILYNHALIASQYGIKPVWILPTLKTDTISESERLRQWLVSNRVPLVHTSGHVDSMEAAAEAANVPIVRAVFADRINHKELLRLYVNASSI